MLGPGGRWRGAQGEGPHAEIAVRVVDCGDEARTTRSPGGCESEGTAVSCPAYAKGSCAAVAEQIVRRNRPRGPGERPQGLEQRAGRPIDMISIHAADITTRRAS
ncbi:hypothetical protein ACTI_70970 [Actinoplanes sp. OR16]|nr:hypothetical protein ACTI_70970 [Actinoplanes sp. OR16]